MKVIGYKIFKIEGNQLVSPFRNFRWDGSSQEAILCHKTRSSIGKHCQCGFNAFYEIEEAIEYGKKEKVKRFVVAAVLGWGEVRFTQKVWRSQYSRIIALIETPEAYFVPYFNKSKVSQYLGIPIIEQKNIWLLKELGDLPEVYLQNFKSKVYNKIPIIGPPLSYSKFIFLIGFTIFFLGVSVCMLLGDTTPPALIIFFVSFCLFGAFSTYSLFLHIKSNIRYWIKCIMNSFTCIRVGFR